MRIKFKTIMYFIVSIIIVFSIGCAARTIICAVKDQQKAVETDNEPIKQDDILNDKLEINNKFQNKYSMDWDCIDECNLLKLATYKGGSIDTRAYNIIVTLNRVFDKNYPNNILGVVCSELYNYNKISEYDYESIMPDEDSKKAMTMVYDGWDETNGSLEYKN